MYPCSDSMCERRQWAGEDNHALIALVLGALGT